MKTGFIQPEITVDNHVFGSVGIPLPLMNPSGDWTAHLPSFESQLQTFDSSGCTCYGTTNAIETLEKYLYGEFNNYSDRFIYNEAKVTPPGADPHLIATTIRGSGLAYEIDLPDDVTSLTEFMTPRPNSLETRIKGLKWLNKRQLGHQWLWTSKPDLQTRLSLIKEALTKGTVCVSVSAWFQNAQGLYYSPPSSINGHWTHIYKADSTGIYVFDSYEPHLKVLTLDHDIQYGKVYFFTKPTDQQNWLLNLIANLLEIVGLKQKELEEVVKPPLKEVYPTSLMPLINRFCNGIKEYEGKPGDLNYLNNNPGNIRGVDGKFLKFKTWDEGFNYLQDYVKRVIRNEHKAYPKNCTILQFFKVYAPSDDKNNPTLYAAYVARKCGLSVNDKLSVLLS